jgi:hypothetical protein
MAPIVDDMKSKKTIGLFFLKDIFWLLRSSKFEFLDKSVFTLLKTIYQEVQEAISNDSQPEGDEDTDEDIYEGEDEDEEKAFLEALAEEEKLSRSQNSLNRSRSYGHRSSDKSVPNPDVIHIDTKDTCSSLNNIVGIASKEKLVDEIKKVGSKGGSINKSNKKSSNSSKRSPNTKFGNESTELRFKKRKTNDHFNSDSKFKQRERTLSINSFGFDFK